MVRGNPVAAIPLGAVSPSDESTEPLLQGPLPGEIAMTGAEALVCRGNVGRVQGGIEAQTEPVEKGDRILRQALSYQEGERDRSKLDQLTPYKARASQG